MDDPANTLPLLPSWLRSYNHLDKAVLQEEILGFCQHYVSRRGDNLFLVRNFEASFCRVVNLACMQLERDTFEELLEGFPPRFRQQLLALPQQWHDLREREYAYTEEEFVRCSRNSLRFCQQLMEQL